MKAPRSPKKPTARRSNLHRKILSQLSEVPAESVTALAAVIASSRPATSRALHRLVRHGVVLRSGRRWALTEAGRKEHESLILSPAVQRALAQELRWRQEIVQSAVSAMRPSIDVFARSAMSAIPPSIDAFTRVLQEQQGQQLSFLQSAMRPTVEVARISEQIARTLEATTGRSLTLAIQSTFESQRLASEALASALSTHQWLTPVLAETLPYTSRMLADLTRMEIDLASSTRPIVKAIGAHLAAMSNAVADAHRVHISTSIHEPLPATPSAAVKRFVVPSYSAATVVGGAAYALERPTNTERDQTRVAAELSIGRLKRRLAEVDPVLADAWEAAWRDALHRGPDWVRGAMHHARETLRLLLEKLAPDDVFDCPPEDITRRMRTQRILGSRSLGNLADVTAKHVDELYGALSADAHHSGRPRVGGYAVVGVLMMTGGLMVLLLDARISDK